MSVKIYDSTIGAFKDAETPLIWDEQTQAWKDSTGLVWNESAQAWEERWSSFAGSYLYNKGNEFDSVTGGWKTAAFGDNAIATKNDDNIYIHSYRASIYTAQKVDLSGYSRLVLHLSEVKGRTDNARSYCSVRLSIGYSLAVSYGNTMGWSRESNSLIVAEANDNDSDSQNLCGKTVTDYELEIDISKISGSYYIAVLVDDSKSNAYGYVTQIWLE